MSKEIRRQKMSRKKEPSSETANQILAKRLRYLLEKLNVNQSQLADKISKKRQTTSNYCNGQSVPDAYTLAKIADELGVTTDYLVERSNIPIPTIDDDAILQRTRLTPEAFTMLSKLDGVALMILNELLASDEFMWSYLNRIADVTSFCAVSIFPRVERPIWAR